MGQHGHFSPGVGRGQDPAATASTTRPAPATLDSVDNKHLLRDRCRVVSTARKTTSSSSSNDVLPLLISILEKPTTQAEGAQRAFSTVRVLQQSLLHAASPGTHPYDLLQVMASYIFDCSEWYRESEVRKHSLQQQLDDSNAKLLEQFNVQNAEILNLQEQLKKSQAAQDFYR
jgi:hypothetical protein